MLVMGMGGVMGLRRYENSVGDGEKEKGRVWVEA